MRILLDVGQLRNTIKNGVEQKVWVYYDSEGEFGYDRESPPPAWQISDEAILYTPEEAARLKIRIKGKWTGDGPGPAAKCPVCGMPEDQCICEVDGGDGGGIPAKFVGQGAVNQAFQQILDQCQENVITHLSHLFIKIDGMGKQIAKDMRALGLAVPQFGKGYFAVEHNLTATYGKESDQEAFSQSFKGGWDRYKRLKTITDSFGQEADELKVVMRVGAEFEAGLEVQDVQFGTIRDVLVTLELGKIYIEAIPIIPEQEIIN